MEETKKLIPKRRFKEFQNAGEWEQKGFRKIFNHLQNNSFSRAQLSYVTGEVMNIHYGDILVEFGECLDISHNVLPQIINGDFVNKYRNSFIENGDVIIADAAEDATVGKCCEIMGLHGQKILSGLHTIPCRPIKSFATGYLGYYMNSEKYHDQLLPLIQGTKVSSISKSALTNTYISYPRNIKEQEKIGAYFIELDNLITLQQSKLEKIKSIKKAYLYEMFPAEGESKPKRRFKGFSDDWERCKLENGTVKIGDGLHGTPRYSESGNVFFVNGNNFANGKILYTEETKCVTEQEQSPDDKLLNENTILMSINGTIGNLAFYEGEKIMLGKSAAYIIVRDFDKKFLYSYLQTSVIKKHFMNNLTGTTIKNLGLRTIRETQIFVPHIKEQNKIGTFFFNLDTLVIHHQSKLDKLKNLKKAYLNEMFI